MDSSKSTLSHITYPISVKLSLGLVKSSILQHIGILWGTIGEGVFFCEAPMWMARLAKGTHLVRHPIQGCPRFDRFNFYKRSYVEVSIRSIYNYNLQMVGSWILDPGSWILDPGCGIQDPGSWILDPGSWTQVVIVNRSNRYLDVTAFVKIESIELWTALQMSQYLH